jgi:hypothetical protein
VGYGYILTPAPEKDKVKRGHKSTGTNYLPLAKYCWIK